MIKLFAKPLAKQLRQPQGFWGLFICSLLNRINTTIITQTIALLRLKNQDKVLDIGFGGGKSFSLLFHINETIEIHGLEISEKAIEKANRDFRKQIANNKLHLRKGNVTDLPYPDNYFDHIISINTVYFWDDLETAFRDIHRVLKPNSTVILALREAETLKKISVTRFGFAFHETANIIKALEAAGFRYTMHHGEDDKPFLCIKAMT